MFFARDRAHISFVYLDAVTEQGYNPVARYDRNEIALLNVLRYGLPSCHWSAFSCGR